MNAITQAVQLLENKFFDHYWKSYQIILFLRGCSSKMFCFHLGSSDIQHKDTSSSLGYYHLSLSCAFLVLHWNLQLHSRG